MIKKYVPGTTPTLINFQQKITLMKNDNIKIGTDPTNMVPLSDTITIVANGLYVQGNETAILGVILHA